jgi:hypothetical protein
MFFCDNFISDPDELTDFEFKEEDEETEVNNSPVNIGLVLEPWDWRKDCCMQAPLVRCLTKNNWTAHVQLRPG